MDYFPPKHNLDVFNPNEFPLISQSVADLTTLNDILDETVTNNVIITRNTTLINSFNKLYTATIPTTTNLYFNSGYFIALPSGSTPPNLVPFMLIVNLPLSLWTNGASISSVSASLLNSKAGVGNINQVWNQAGNLSSGYNIKQTNINPQFIFTGVGNGGTYQLQIIVQGVTLSNPTFGNFAINANATDINGIQMILL
jgi:hypothetical protein